MSAPTLFMARLIEFGLIITILVAGCDSGQLVGGNTPDADTGVPVTDVGTWDSTNDNAYADSEVDSGVVGDSSVDGTVDSGIIGDSSADSEVDSGVVGDSSVDGEVDSGVIGDSSVDSEVDSGVVGDSSADSEVDSGIVGDSSVDSEVDSGIVGDSSVDGEVDSGIVGDSSVDGSVDSGSSGSGSAEQYPYDPVQFAFRQKIPPGIPDDPRSGDVVALLDLNTSLSKVNLSVDGEVPPVYVVGPADPFYSITVSGGTSTTFRVPANAVPGGGADYPLVLLDPDHPDWGPFTELRLWQASINDATQTLSASGSGLFHYNNDGAILNPDGTPSISVPFTGWGTGSGLSILAGLIRPDEVSKGKIEHAIRFAYSACDSTNTFRPPATKTDQPNGCSTVDPPSAMEMGMRLQLDPAVDCDARTVPGKSDTSNETRFLRMFCTALQDYGMIMVDGTGYQGLIFMMENKATADWQSIVGAELYGSYSYIIRDQDTPSDGLTRGISDGIPWHSLRVLQESVF